MVFKLHLRANLYQDIQSHQNPLQSLKKGLKMALPAGYRIYKEDNESITVLITDFSLMRVDSEPFILYNNKSYSRGMIECIPDRINACSCRKYNLIGE